MPRWKCCMDLSISWWVWIVIGFALLLAELLTPGGFYIVFFGVGGVVVGLLKALGLVSSFAIEGLLFVVLSLAGLAVFRKPLQQRFTQLTPQIPVDEIEKESVTAIDDIPAGGIGKVELRGTPWNAHNAGTDPIFKAQRCRIDRIDGITLHVRPVNPAA